MFEMLNMRTLLAVAAAGCAIAAASILVAVAGPAGPASADPLICVTPGPVRVGSQTVTPPKACAL